MGKVAILGGYGNFGKRIARALAAKGIDVVIVGRDRAKAEALAEELGARVTGVAAAIPGDLAEFVQNHRPDVLINTVGPFQGQDYAVARFAIAAGVHYVDLADARDFVCGIAELDADAKAAGVSVVSGASTVPALSDAVICAHRDQFERIDTLRYGISPGQKTERGLATAQAVLSYVGQPLAPFPGIRPKLYGWQDIYRQDYPGLGKRWLGNCDIPDLDLFPARHGISTVQFSAGLELGALQLGLWATSWVIRAGIPLPMSRFAGPLLSASNWLNGLGSADGGMHVVLRGPRADAPDEVIELCWYIIAREGDGPQIPTIPAILMAEKLLAGTGPEPGATPCVGLINLDEYIAALGAYRIETSVTTRTITG